MRRRSMVPIYLLSGFLSSYPAFMGVLASERSLNRRLLGEKSSDDEDTPDSAGPTKSTLHFQINPDAVEFAVKEKPDISELVLTGPVPLHNPIKVVLAEMPALKSIKIENIPRPIRLRLEGDLLNLRQIQVGKGIKLQNVEVETESLSVSMISLFPLSKPSPDEDTASSSELRSIIGELRKNLQIIQNENFKFSMQIQELDLINKAVRQYNLTLMNELSELDRR